MDPHGQFQKKLSPTSLTAYRKNWQWQQQKKNEIEVINAISFKARIPNLSETMIPNFSSIKGCTNQ